MPGKHVSLELYYYLILLSDVLCFDNSFSWTRSKKVYYTCDVIAPDDTLISKEINRLIENGDWQSLSERFETTHL